MVALASLATVVIAGTASLFMAWTIGAGSSGSTPFAPAVGANAISVLRAGLIVGVLGLFGAVLQGANVSSTMGTKLVEGTALTPLAAAVALFVAAGFVAVGIYTGYPIATAFTATGAVVGAGLAMGGSPAWGTYQEIVSLWLLVPIVGGAAAYATAKLLRGNLPEWLGILPLGLLVGAVLSNISFSILGPGGASIAETIAAGTTLGIAAVTGVIAAVLTTGLVLDVRRDPESGLRHFLLTLGGLVAFSAGGSQVGLAVGPLLPLFTDVPITTVLLGGGLGLLVGSWTGAPRMIKTLSREYASLGPRRSIAALIPSFLIAQTAVFFGIPVSFNEIIVSAIVGSGFAARQGGTPDAVSPRKMGYTVLAWVVSLAGALIVAFLAFSAVGGFA